MNHKKTNYIFKALLALVFAAVFSFNGFSYTILNGIEMAFPPPPTSGLKTTSLSIGSDNYIIEGAGYFLESYTNTLLFMKKIELSGVDGYNTDELNAVLDKAITNIKLASNAYLKLIKESENLPYITTVLESLKKIDYAAFKSEIFANKEIFNEVREYLYKGDIRGVYKKMLANTEQIAGILSRMKEKVDGGVLAVISDTYRVNQTFSRSLLFGQYVAQVFGRMLGYN
jgi:hypothetical protein